MTTALASKACGWEAGRNRTLSPQMLTPPGSSTACLFQEALSVMCVSTGEAGMILGALGKGLSPNTGGDRCVAGCLGSSAQMALLGQSFLLHHPPRRQGSLGPPALVSSALDEGLGLLTPQAARAPIFCDSGPLAGSRPGSGPAVSSVSLLPTCPDGGVFNFPVRMSVSSGWGHNF